GGVLGVGFAAGVLDDGHGEGVFGGVAGEVGGPVVDGVLAGLVDGDGVLVGLVVAVVEGVLDGVDAGVLVGGGDGDFGGAEVVAVLVLLAGGFGGDLRRGGVLGVRVPAAAVVVGDD